MSHNGHDAYLEGRILSADPLELVRLLYQGCSDAVRDARRRLAAGEIPERGRAISNACEVLTELVTALDRERGGEVAERLSLLYDYMQRQLLDAHLRQADEPLVEVLGLLATLGEAWAGVQAQTRPAEPERSEWARMTPESEPAVSHAWSW
jgi:flagellar secretion chaperone FliS